MLLESHMMNQIFQNVIQEEEKEKDDQIDKPIP